MNFRNLAVSHASKCFPNGSCLAESWVLTKALMQPSEHLGSGPVNGRPLAALAKPFASSFPLMSRCDVTLWCSVSWFSFLWQLHTTSESNLTVCRAWRAPWLSNASTDPVLCEEAQISSAQVWMVIDSLLKMDGELHRVIHSPAGSPSFQVPMPCQCALEISTNKWWSSYLGLRKWVISVCLVGIAIL